MIVFDNLSVRLQCPEGGIITIFDRQIIKVLQSYKYVAHPIFAAILLHTHDFQPWFKFCVAVLLYPLDIGTLKST